MQPHRVTGDQLGRALALAIDGPQSIDTAIAVAHEDDPRAIGGVTRGNVPVPAAYQQPRVPPADRDGVQVPEQIEHDLLPVGRDVDVHRRSLVRLELDHPARHEWTRGTSSVARRFRAIARHQRRERQTNYRKRMLTYRHDVVVAVVDRATCRTATRR